MKENNHKVGDIISVQDKDTNYVMECVITKISLDENGNIYFFIRRKNNKPFRNKKHNAWIKFDSGK